MAAPGGSGPGSASNPRKFSEKIALQRQRQAAETAAFEEVMMDIGSTRVQVQKLRMAHMRGPYYGGSLPNVNQISCGPAEFQGPPQSPLDQSRSTRHRSLVDRVHRDPRRMMSPLRRYMRQVDSSPYNVSYLSPHQESGLRRNLPWGNYPSDTGQLFRLPSALNRTNSDSALHTSAMEPYPVLPQGVSTPTRRSAFPFPVPGIEEAQDGGHLLKPFDAKKMPSASGRPKSCEVPGINIYPSADQPANVAPVSSVLNTGGSLPDLTNLHFPSPLPTPLDPEESGFGSLSGGSSTGNLTSTMTHLGIGRIGLPPGFDSSGFSSASAMQNSLSRQSLQSSLSNPNLQTSLSSASLQTSFSNPSLQSSLSSQSLPSSLSNQSLSPSVSSHSLPSGYSTPSSPSSSSSFPPMAPTSLNTSPRRRVPLSPLTLPMAGDSRRSHQKQFSPTMSPTLTSITQGVPLDTSKMPADQRLPPYHFNHPNLFPQAQMHHSQASVHESQQPLHQSQQPLHEYHQSQQPLHQSPPSVHDSQHPLHEYHQSQQPLHHSQPSVHNSQQPSHQASRSLNQHQQPLLEGSRNALPNNDHHEVPSSMQPFSYQQNSEGPPYQYLLEDYNMSNSLLSSLFDDCDLQLSAQRPGSLSQQFEQCNMVEDGRLGLTGSSFPGEYPRVHITGLGGSSSCNSQSFRKQNNNCGRHDPIPNIILTAVDSPPGFSKEITSALSCVPGFEVDQSLGLEEDLNIEPLTLDGLNMLCDPYAPLTDPLVEDSFRCDRLQ